MTDERLARDLAKNAGPTDNAGNPITSPGYDPLTHVLQPASEVEAVDMESDMDEMVNQWCTLPAVAALGLRCDVGQIIDPPELEAALYAIAANVVGYEADAESEDDNAAAEPATGSWGDEVKREHEPGAVVVDVPRGDTVVTDAG